LTVADGEHEQNHKVRLYDDGKVRGKYNVFAFDWTEAKGTYFKAYLEDWLSRIKTKSKPYWDEIDGKPVSK
jgi:hypothetical protein